MAKDYVDGQLGFEANTQTAFANAIYLKVLNVDEQRNAGARLAELIKANDKLPKTGFLGFKPLLPALSQTGNSQLAYELLLNERCPSLGFEVVNGDLGALE